MEKYNFQDYIETYPAYAHLCPIVHRIGQLSDG